jgi:hypothetical protein
MLKTRLSLCAQVIDCNEDVKTKHSQNLSRECRRRGTSETNGGVNVILEVGASISYDHYTICKDQLEANRDALLSRCDVAHKKTIENACNG